MSKSCIFCKIIQGINPGFIIHESDTVMAILDIFPLTKGHMLVIPKQHYQDIFDIPADTLQEIVKVTQEMAILAQFKLEADGINILHSSCNVAGQTIFHTHFHVVPRYSDDGISLWADDKPRTDIDFSQLKAKLLSK